MSAKKDAIGRLAPAHIELAQIGLARVEPTRVGPPDADVMGEYLSRAPLHNIYLIHAFQQMQTAAAARPDVAGDRASTSGAAREPSTDSSVFWGAFAKLPTDFSSGRTGASDERHLAGMLLIEPSHRDRRGRVHRQGGSVGYLAYVHERISPPEALACLGTIAARSGVRTLIGHRATVEPALAGLEDKWRIQTRLLHFYQADPERLVRSYAHPVRRATEDDIPDMVGLYRGYEFSRRDATDNDIRREIEQAMHQSGVYFCVEAPDDQDGANSAGSTHRIISAARVYPETDDAGLIGAARTLPEYRGQGIYLAVRTACFEHLFAQGKTGLGMFLDSNTSMHRVIKKQGGTILAEWLIADLQLEPPTTLARLRRRLIPAQVRQWATRLYNRLYQGVYP